MAMPGGGHSRVDILAARELPFDCATSLLKLPCSAPVSEMSYAKLPTLVRRVPYSVNDSITRPCSTVPLRAIAVRCAGQLSSVLHPLTAAAVNLIALLCQSYPIAKIQVFISSVRGRFDAVCH